MEKCYHEVIKQEQKQGWRYEFIARVRPGIINLTQDYIYHNFDLKATEARDGMIHTFNYPGESGMPDQFALMHRSLMKVYFTVVEAYRYCWKKDDLQETCTGHAWLRPYDAPPECFMPLWLHHHGIDWQSHSFGTRACKGDWYIFYLT